MKLEFLILVSSICISKSEWSGGVARYDHYHIFHVEINTKEQADMLSNLEKNSDSCIFYGHVGFPGKSLTIMVAAHKVADFHCLMKDYGIPFEILVTNFQEKIDRQLLDVLPPTTSPENYDWTHYFHLETIDSWLEKVAEEHDFVSVIEIGQSHLGAPVKGVKIAKNESNTAVFVESGIHAREWIAPATATYIINQLLTSTDKDIQTLLDDFNWIILPVVNPDGYKYSFEHDRMWRKNRKAFGICYGVDLNRNFPFHWNTTGVSPDPCHFAFPGLSEKSEKETQNIIEYIKQHAQSENIKTFLSLHSYSQLIMFPYGYGPERVENYDDLKLISEIASEAIYNLPERVYIPGSIYETIYPSSGGSKDWAYAEAKIPITFTFELRGPPTSTDLFILPADQILPTGQETLEAFKTILFEARKLGYY